MLQEIETKIGMLRAELKPIENKADEIRSNIRKLLKDAEQYKLDNGLFEPISKLKNYIGKSISSIDLVEELEDGTLKINSMYGDEYFDIDENGHLDYSSERGGVMSYDSDIEKYIMWYFYHKTEHKFIGYIDLCIKEPDEI